MEMKLSTQKFNCFLITTKTLQVSSYDLLILAQDFKYLLLTEQWCVKEKYKSRMMIVSFYWSTLIYIWAVELSRQVANLKPPVRLLRKKPQTNQTTLFWTTISHLRLSQKKIFEYMKISASTRELSLFNILHDFSVSLVDF